LIITSADISVEQNSKNGEIKNWS